MAEDFSVESDRARRLQEARQKTYRQAVQEEDGPDFIPDVYPTTTDYSPYEVGQAQRDAVNQFIAPSPDTEPQESNAFTTEQETTNNLQEDSLTRDLRRKTDLQSRQALETQDVQEEEEAPQPNKKPILEDAAADAIDKKTWSWGAAIFGSPFTFFGMPIAWIAAGLVSWNIVRQGSSTWIWYPKTRLLQGAVMGLFILLTMMICAVVVIVSLIYFKIADSTIFQILTGS
jgi:hypothetical protein